jgi:hypothetical protein
MFSKEKEKWFKLTEFESIEELKEQSSKDSIIRKYSKAQSSEKSVLYLIKGNKHSYIGQSSNRRLHKQHRDRHSNKDKPGDIITRAGTAELWVCELDGFDMHEREKLERRYIDKYRSELNLINEGKGYAGKRKEAVESQRRTNTINYFLEAV